jgi:hypothetical protein
MGVSVWSPPLAFVRLLLEVLHEKWLTGRASAPNEIGCLLRQDIRHTKKHFID